MAFRVLPLRAPSGETQWTIVELQGSVEGKTSSLDGLHLGDLSERRVSVHTAGDPRAFPACRAGPATTERRNACLCCRAPCGCASAKQRCLGKE
jgi:hypothetical protein